MPPPALGIRPFYPDLERRLSLKTSLKREFPEIE
jgi:hypothetical protein